MVSVQLHMCNVQKDGEIASMEERRHIFDLWTKEWCFLVPGERTVVHCILGLRKITFRKMMLSHSALGTRRVQTCAWAES